MAADRRSLLAALDAPLVIDPDSENSQDGRRPRTSDEPGHSDSDSSSSAFLDFASVASSIPNFVYRNGRRFLEGRGEGYALPNDGRAQERLEFWHYMLQVVLNGELCYTQLDNPQRILDIGTGTGAWVMDMAERFPLAEVIGTDLSPIQPSWRPPNVDFVVEDAREDWTFPAASFDFIHLRMFGEVLNDTDTRVLQHCFNHLKPGGRIEISDLRMQLLCDDDTYPPSSYLRQICDEVLRIASAHGLSLDYLPSIPALLESLGFTSVSHVATPLPVGSWPKDPALKARGRLFQAELASFGVELYAHVFMERMGGWSRQEAMAAVEQARAEMRGSRMHVYSHYSFVVGRKPE